jgi:membrane carboxypeptidase/penicillin-binding protein PbpC
MRGSWAVSRCLRKSADYYGPAIALGDGAVTLHDMVQSYASLARSGIKLVRRFGCGAKPRLMMRRRFVLT